MTDRSCPFAVLAEYEPPPYCRHAWEPRHYEFSPGGLDLWCGKCERELHLELFQLRYADRFNRHAKAAYMETLIDREGPERLGDVDEWAEAVLGVSP